MLVLCYFLGSVYLEGVGGHCDLSGVKWLSLPCVRVPDVFTSVVSWVGLSLWITRPSSRNNKQPNYSVIRVCRMFTQGKLLCDNNSTHRHWPRESQMTLQQTTVNNLKIFCSYWLAVKQKNNLSCLSLVFFLL